MPHTPPAPSAPVRRPRSDAVVVISSDDEDQCDRSNSEHSSPLDCIVLGSSCTRQRITDSTSAAAPLPAPLPCSGMYLTTVQVRCCSPPQHSFPSPLCRHNCERMRPPPDALHASSLLYMASTRFCPVTVVLRLSPAPPPLHTTPATNRTSRRALQNVTLTACVQRQALVRFAPRFVSPARRNAVGALRHWQLHGRHDMAAPSGACAAAFIHIPSTFHFLDFAGMRHSSFTSQPAS
jgi:hypothetical protein